MDMICSYHKAFVHIDVCGSLSTMAKGGLQYVVTFIDDFSRYRFLYLMKYKSKTFEKLKEFKNEVQNQHARILKLFNHIKVGYALLIAAFTFNCDPLKAVLKTGCEIY
ncbi:hypothetical protein CR513_42200, partial [Mucuna pruriens]